MNRIDRLFGILTLVQSRRYVGAEKIAEKFNISIRTVYRDIKAINESGIPINFEPNKGYFVVKGFFLSPISFTNEEANALVLIENLVKGFTDQFIQQHYSSALNKVKAVLGASQQQKIETLSETTKTQLPACFGANNNYLSFIQEAISNKTVITIKYNNKNGEHSQRKVEPIGIVFYALSWHMIAWCQFRKEYRDFKVSRIEELQKTTQFFENINHVSLQEYMQNLPVDY